MTIPDPQLLDPLPIGIVFLLLIAVLVIVLGAVITLTVDLDRPRDGLLVVSQQPLLDLAAEIGPPPS